MSVRGRLFTSNTIKWDIHNACDGGDNGKQDLEIVKVYLEENNDTEAIIYKCTLLHSASIGGSVEIVWLLLKYGADIDAKTQHNRTALDLAACNGHIEIVKLLLKCGIDINITDCTGKTADQYTDLPKMRAFLEMYKQILTVGEWRPHKASKYPLGGRKAASTVLFLAKGTF